MDSIDFSKCPYHERLRDRIDTAVEILTKRADKYDEQVVTNTNVIADIKEKAAVTREQTTMIFTILGEIKQQLKELTLAIRDIPSEQEVKIDAKIKELKDQKTDGKWYDSDMGKFAIKGGVIVIIMLAAAAIGQNVIKDLVPILGN